MAGVKLCQKSDSISLCQDESGFFMQECSECKTKFDPKTSIYKYFCSEKCKLAYWHESADTPNKRIPKTIPQIQAALKQKALEIKATQKVVEPEETEEDLLTYADRMFEETGQVVAH